MSAPKLPYVVGIDPSLAATGIATEDETWTVRTESSDPERLLKIYSAVERALYRNPVIGNHYLAVIEDLPKNGKSAGLTGMSQGAVRLACIQTATPYYLVPPGTLKKFATGVGNCDKHLMRMAAFKRAGVEFPDDNQADAWWLRQLGLHLAGSFLAMDLPKAQMASVDVVRERGLA
jgi:Holliday junction resolvasome RuvABC endonuclease subunit